MDHSQEQSPPRRQHQGRLISAGSEGNKDPILHWPFGEGWWAIARLADPGTGELFVSELLILPEEEYLARYWLQDRWGRDTEFPSKDFPSEFLKSGLLPPELLMDASQIPPGGLTGTILRQLPVGEMRRGLVEGARQLARLTGGEGFFSPEVRGLAKSKRRRSPTEDAVAETACWYLDAFTRDPRRPLRRMVEDEMEQRGWKRWPKYELSRRRDDVRRARSEEYEYLPKPRAKGSMAVGITPALREWLRQHPEKLDAYPGVRRFMEMREGEEAEGPTKEDGQQ